MKENTKEIKKIKKGNSVIILTMFFIPFMIIVAIIGSLSYFNTKEVNLLETKCEQSDGESVIDKSFLTIEYSFECK